MRRHERVRSHARAHAETIVKAGENYGWREWGGWRGPLNVRFVHDLHHKGIMAHFTGPLISAGTACARVSLQLNTKLIGFCFVFFCRPSKSAEVVNFGFGFGRFNAFACDWLI